MLKNYLKVAFRALRKQAGYTLINVGGLGLGLACCFLIVLFIRHELAYDRFHENGDRIYRVLVGEGTDDGASATTPAGMAHDLPPRLPEIEAAVRVENSRRPYLRVGSDIRRVEGFALADASLFDVFSFRLLRGNPATALADPYGLVLTETAAEGLFGGQDPMGQAVSMPFGSEELTFTVTGVMADLPDNSHLRFNYLGSFLLLPTFMGDGALEDYTNLNYETYFLLRPGSDPAAVAAKMNALAIERLGDNDGRGYGLALQPLPAIHFTTDIRFDDGAHRDRRYLYLFGAIALFVLLIACVNFMNLATARAVKRAREVGVRKAIGAEQGQLVRQFLGESVMLSAFAIVLAFALAALALPVFNEAMGTQLSLLGGGIGTGMTFVGIGLLAGVLAGSYPAFYLSLFQPSRVLRGEVTRGQGATLLRRGLIIGQFAISIFLIVATLTVYRQLHHMQTRNLGFRGEQVVFLSPPPSLWQQYDAFRERLRADPRILSVARAGGLPGRTGTNRGYNWPGRNADGTDGQQGAGFWTIPADPDYIETLGLELAAGRSFSPDVPTDTLDTYILNEAAVRQIGWTAEEAIDQPFRAWDRPMGKVIGVVKDFHFQSLHQEIQPLVINYIPWFGSVAIRLAPGSIPAALDHVRAQWSAFAPGYVFDYTFLDEDFGRLYREEEKLGQLFGLFAGLAVFIACLGLFALAAYSAEQRTKEIGVRKVMGASVRDIALLLSRESIVLVVIAFAAAAPLAYYAMSRWLDGFAYRFPLGPGVFVLAALLALAVAGLTVSYQAFRAATADPVKSLRAE